MTEQPSQNNQIRLFEQKILIIKLQYVGDTIGIIPVVTRLKNHAPGLTVDVLIHQESAELIAHCVNISKVWTYDRQKAKKDLFSMITYNLSLIRKLRRERYDIVIALTQGDRAFFLSFVTGAPLRLTYKTSSQLTRLMNAFAPVKPGRRHFIELDADIVNYFSISSDDIQPVIHIPEAVRTQIKDRLISAIDAQGVMVVIHPGARKHIRRWKPDRYAQIASLLHEQHRASIVLLGGYKEEDLLEEIEREMGFAAAYKSCNIALIEMAAIFSECDLFIGNDSGPGHIAAAVGCPTLSLFGPNFPDICRPYSNSGVVIFKELPCCGCRQERHLCVRLENTCMDMIEVDEVWLEVKKMLSKFAKKDKSLQQA